MTLGPTLGLNTWSPHEANQILEKTGVPEVVALAHPNNGYKLPNS
ncbi:hypothetical protein ACFL1B_03850 [Nanoarchaeota archaeon]